MDPKFECPACGSVVPYQSTAGQKSVTLSGKIYFRDIDAMLSHTLTFCDLSCMMDYITKWYKDSAEKDNA